MKGSGGRRPPLQFYSSLQFQVSYLGGRCGRGRGLHHLALEGGDGADPAEFMHAIGNLEGGAEALADYFAEKRSRIEAFARSGTFDTAEDDGEILTDSALLASAYIKPRVEQDEVADQDWMELAWILRYQCADLFIEMLLVLRAKARAFDAGLVEEDEAEADDDKVDTRDTDRGTATPAARESDEESAI